MSALETTEYDEDRVNEESRRFAADLFARFPEFRQYAAMERLPGSEEWWLVVTVPSPSGDPESRLLVWMNGGDEPSVGFGGWHGHEGFLGAVDEEPRVAFLDLIAGILEDRSVVCERSDGAMRVDFTTDGALLEELTSTYASGRVRVRSWSGKLDRTVDLDGLGPENTT